MRPICCLNASTFLLLFLLNGSYYGLLIFVNGIFYHGIRPNCEFTRFYDIITNIFILLSILLKIFLSGWIYFLLLIGIVLIGTCIYLWNSWIRKDGFNVFYHIIATQLFLFVLYKFEI